MWEEDDVIDDSGSEIKDIQSFKNENVFNFDYQQQFERQKQDMAIKNAQEKSNANNDFYKRMIKGFSWAFFAMCIFFIFIFSCYALAFIRYLYCLDNCKVTELSAFLLESINQIKGVIAGIMLGIVSNKLYDMSKKFKQ